MSASLLDTLQSHIFPPRGLHRTPTAPRPATSTQTTVVDIALVAACIRASSPDSIDSNPNPSVVFSCLNTQDEDEDERIHRVEGGRGDVHDILTTLSSTPSDLVLPLSIPTPEFVSQLQASTPIIQYDSATDKFQHYALLITVYRLLILLLFLSPSNFVGDQKPPLASWELALPPVGPGGSGKSDLEGIRMDGLGVPRRSGILWEYKRGLVLPLALLMIMVASGMRPGGFRLGLDREGEPVLDDDTLGDHVLKWCSQASPPYFTPRSLPLFPPLRSYPTHPDPAFFPLTYKTALTPFPPSHRSCSKWMPTKHTPLSSPLGIISSSSTASPPPV